MKIEKMCSKQDVVTSLKKAANYSKLEHLKKLAEYIQQEIELDNLKDNMELSSYEIKVGNGKYQIVKVDTRYSSEKNNWEQIGEKVVYEIPLSEIEAIQL